MTMASILDLDLLDLWDSTKNPAIQITTEKRFMWTIVMLTSILLCFHVQVDDGADHPDWQESNDFNFDDEDVDDDYDHVDFNDTHEVQNDIISNPNPNEEVKV